MLTRKSRSILQCRLDLRSHADSCSGNRYLCRDCLNHGLPVLTVGVEVAIALVLPPMDIDQAKKAFLGWTMDSQCYRNIAFTDGGNVKTLMSNLHRVVNDSDWVNPSEAQATQLLINAVTRLPWHPMWLLATVRSACACLIACLEPIGISPIRRFVSCWT